MEFKDKFISVFKNLKYMNVRGPQKVHGNMCSEKMA